MTNTNALAFQNPLSLIFFNFLPFPCRKPILETGSHETAINLLPAENLQSLCRVELFGCRQNQKLKRRVCVHHECPGDGLVIMIWGNPQMRMRMRMRQ